MGAYKSTRDRRRGVLVNKSRNCRPSLAKASTSIGEHFVQEPAPGSVPSNVREILSVASRIASMPDREAIERYHCLMDKKLTGFLNPTEIFELERIETRLDAADRDYDLEARDREMELDRGRILESIHTLLAQLGR